MSKRKQYLFRKFDIMLSENPLYERHLIHQIFNFIEDYDTTKGYFKLKITGLDFISHGSYEAFVTKIFDEVFWHSHNKIYHLIDETECIAFANDKYNHEQYFKLLCDRIDTYYIKSAKIKLMYSTKERYGIRTMY